MNYIQYMKPGSKFWALPNGLEDVSWSEFLNNWKQAIEKAKDQIIDKWENLKQDYKDAADPIAASKRRQAESIEATRAKQASMKFVSDNRTDHEKKRDRRNFELKEFEQKRQLNKEATDAVMWTLTGPVYAVQHLASPNGVVKTYGNTKAAVQNGGGPYIEKAVASAAGDVLDASILAAPLFTPKARLARAMNKNIRNTTLQPTVADEAILRGQLGWAPKQTIPYRHGSLDPDLKTFVPKHDRWDVVTHGADPNMYFVTHLSTPVSAANMMDLRPYQYTGSIVAEKPMVQVGDFNIAGKNATRNQLIARARQQGADAYLLQDIVDNKVPHLNVVARFIGPEGEAVQGGAASIKWYGPTMGKTTAVKTNPNLVDIDPLLKPIRAKHAERLELKISDPKVSADPAYKQEVADFILEWRANPENQGKTLVASTKHLLDPQYKVEFANEPSIPDFETFAARNKARGFKETDEQLRAWYNSILELGRDLNVDNRYVSDIESGTRAARISEAERLGIPKGDRGNLSESQQEAVRDLYHYITDGKFRLKFLYDPEKGMFYFGTKTSTTPSGLQTMLNAPEKSRTVRAWSDREGIAWIRANLTDGALSYFPETNSTSFTAKMPKYEFLGHWGEASARSRGGFDKEIILTAPKTDAQEYIADLVSSSNADDVLLGQQMQLTLSNTIDKNTVGTFYKQVTSTSKPGTYVSGDVSDYPLGYKAITSYAKGNSSKAISDILSGEVAPITVSSRTGLSPDSYISLLRLSLRPEWNLSFNRKAGFGKWNDSAVHNKHIYDAWQAARNGSLELKLAYIQLFNDWVAPYGGAKAYINDKGIIIHPHPFIVRQKQGGSIHIKKKNKGKFTASAKAAGEGVQEHAHKVMNDPNATPLQKKRANFAIQAKKWHRKHQLGDKINYLDIFA